MKKYFFVMLLFTLFTLTSCLDFVDDIKEKAKDVVEQHITKDDEKEKAKDVIEQHITKDDEKDSDKNDKDFQATTSANISNWGYVASDGKNTYYFNGRDGIYKFNKDKEDELIVSGTHYSDIGIIDDTIYCLDNEVNEIVRINVDNGEKETIYAPDEPLNASIYAINVIDDKYYFLEYDKNLFYIDKNGKVESTKFTSNAGITSSGFYTNTDSNCGLKLVSKIGKTIREFPEFDNCVAYVLFELDNYVYAKITEKDETSAKIYRIDKNTGASSIFPNYEFYDSPDFENANFSLNYYNGTFYLSATLNATNEENGLPYYVHLVYSIDSNGKITPIHKSDNIGAIPYSTICIADNFIFINYPFANAESEIISLKTIQ